MSRTATTPQTAPVGAGPLAAPRIIRQRRIRGGALALAVLLMAVGGLLAGFAFMATARTQTCLAVARTVEAGARLTAADLTTVQINNAPGLKPIPAGQTTQVLGKRATVTLVPGTLLTLDQLTDQDLVGPGQRQVSLGLKPERVPARTLRPGDKVQLVVTPGDNTTASNQQAAAPEKFDATVVDVAARPGTGATDGSVVVYLAVAEQEAPKIGVLSAQGRLTVLLRAGA